MADTTKIGQLPDESRAKIVRIGSSVGMIGSEEHGKAAIRVISSETVQEPTLFDGKLVDIAIAHDSAAAVFSSQRPDGGAVFNLWIWTPATGWRDDGLIPALSVTSLFLVKTHLWALGAETLLMRQLDDQTWNTMASPLSRPIDWTRDRLMSPDGELLVLGSNEGLFTYRGDEKWGNRPVDGAHVRAMEGPLIAAIDHDGKAKVGLVDGLFVNWLLKMKRKCDPIELTCGSGPKPAFQMSASTHHTEKAPGALRITVTPGEGITSSRFLVPGYPPRIALHGSNRMLAVNLSGGIYQTTPEP